MSTSSRSGLTPIASFSRIKPLDADPGGGAAADKQITNWNEDVGTVVMSGIKIGKSKDREFNHFKGVIAPDARQADVYDTIASPVVQMFLSGYDADLISYGQTGSGKTYTIFGPPHSMALAAENMSADAESTIQGDGILREEHGFILRVGLSCLAAVNDLNVDGHTAVLHGSMVEMSIMSFQDQTLCDLLNNRAPCYVDDNYHLQVMVFHACIVYLIHFYKCIEL